MRAAWTVAPAVMPAVSRGDDAHVPSRGGARAPTTDLWLAVVGTFKGLACLPGDRETDRIVSLLVGSMCSCWCLP